MYNKILHVHMYICLYVRMYTYIYMHYIYMHTHIYIYIHKDMKRINNQCDSGFASVLLPAASSVATTSRAQIHNGRCHAVLSALGCVDPWRGSEPSIQKNPKPENLKPKTFCPVAV